jgi:purine nucleoside permease
MSTIIYLQLSKLRHHVYQQLEALTRAARVGLVDYGRIVLLRTGSDFDRGKNTAL